MPNGLMAYFDFNFLFANHRNRRLHHYVNSFALQQNTSHFLLPNVGKPDQSKRRVRFLFWEYDKKGSLNWWPLRHIWRTLYYSKTGRGQIWPFFLIRRGTKSRPPFGLSDLRSKTTNRQPVQKSTESKFGLSAILRQATAIGHFCP